MLLRWNYTFCIFIIDSIRIVSYCSCSVLVHWMPALSWSAVTCPCHLERWQLICSGWAAQFLSWYLAVVSVSDTSLPWTGSFLVPKLVGSWWACCLGVLFTCSGLMYTWVGAEEGVLGKGCSQEQSSWPGRGMISLFSPVSPSQVRFPALCSKGCSVRLRVPVWTSALLLNIFSLHPGFSSLKIWLQCKFWITVHQMSFVTSDYFHKYSKPRSWAQSQGNDVL